MQIYEELIQQNIGVAPSPLFSVLPAQQHYLRINCSFESTPKIQSALEQIIKTIQQRVEAVS
jgi:DNA-binding transcriptional MocR family regulator